MKENELPIPIIVHNFNDINPINPISCGWQRCESSCAAGPSSREYYLMHYIISGKGHYRFNNIRHNISTSDIFLGYPNELIYYEADKDDPWEYVWIGFRGTRAKEFVEKAGFTKDKPFIHASSSAYIFNSVRKLISIKITREIMLKGLVYELFSILIENNSNNSRIFNNKNSYIRNSLDYIKNNYSSHISIQDISHMLNIDRRYFSKLFKEYTGESPQMYLINYRLEKSSELLLKGYTVNEAAQSVGYTDVLHFSKMFKSKYHICPSKYLKVTTNDF